jgi:hemerythrin-like domain-containing protein
MDILQSFAEEHRLIRQVLDAFEAYVVRIETAAPANREDLRKFVAFFQNFAHLHHHDKEEALLFPALALAGLDWSGDPLARIRAEHDQEQYLMRSLSHVAQQIETWSGDDRQHFLSVAWTFLSFQRNHMRFESTEVYPHVDEMSEAARTRLSRDVKSFDESDRESTKRFTEIATSLVRRYVPNQRAGGDPEAQGMQPPVV